MAPRRPKDKKHPKRPLNAYFLFVRKARKNVVRDMGGEKKARKQSHIFKVAGELGKQWRALSDSEREEYQKKAAKSMKEYSKKCREYRGSANWKKHQIEMKEYRRRKYRFDRIAAGLGVRSRKRKRKTTKKSKKKVSRKKKGSGKKKGSSKKKKGSKKKSKKKGSRKKKVSKKKKKTSKKRKKSTKKGGTTLCR